MNALGAVRLPAAATQSPVDPIAVVGLGCVLPDAFEPAAFWSNALQKHSALRMVEDGDWQWRLHASGDVEDPDRLPTLVAAPVRDWIFDWRHFRMPPTEVAETNPMALMVLDAGSQCLESVRTIPKDTTGIFLGATSLGYRKDTGLRVRLPDLLDAARRTPTLAAMPAEQREAVIDAAADHLKQRLRPITADSAINTPPSVAAGRVAMRFDLRGLHYAIDASFASALAALAAGVRSLRDGSLDLALVGAVSEILSPLEVLTISRLGWLGCTRVASFDASADGTLVGEGAVMFALKRLSTARRDGDMIYAVIRGVSGATDRTDCSLLGPGVDARTAAMRRALLDADVDPTTVNFVECDAPGVVEYERAEIEALRRVYGTSRRNPIALTSATPLVGHTRAASGGIGLLHAILALQHASLPAQANFDTPNPVLQLANSPFFIPTGAVPLHRSGTAPVHAAVSAGGLGGVSYHAILEQYEPSTPAETTIHVSAATPEPIAIVGMGAWLPGARNISEFAELLRDGRDMSTCVPSDRWNVDRYFDSDRRRPETSYTRLGCFANQPSEEPGWPLPPDIEVGDAVDPGHLMVLRAAEEALADAHFNERAWNPLRVSISLGLMPFLGRKFLADIRVNSREFEFDLSLALMDAGLEKCEAAAAARSAVGEFKSTLPSLSRDSVLGMLGSIHANRLAKLLKVGGVSFTVDSACASTQAAVYAAVQALRHRACDIALVGGVCSDLQPEYFVACCRFGALSATGITPFDAAADGFIPGEGAGVLVLRRLSDAERDGQRVHALIRSVAGSSDGRGRSVLAPRSEGEALAMERALDQASIDPRSVEYVECHGAGTAVGDVAEVEACTFAYGRDRTRPLQIGSVKSNIGHLNGAAGVPAIIKSVLSVRDGTLYPSLKFSRPNPRIDFQAGPIEVVDSLRSWPAQPGQPRRAGASGFGLGGSNFHVLIEEYRPRYSEHAVAGQRARVPVLPIFAAQGADLEEAWAVLKQQLERTNGAPNAAQAARGGARAHRLAVVALTRDEAAQKLRLAELGMQGHAAWEVLQRQGVYHASGTRPGKLAVMFPGQGTQYPGMLRELLGFPAIAGTIAEADGVYQRLAGRALSSCFLHHTESAIPEEDAHCAVLVVNVALQRLLEQFGIIADSLLGQSAGELAALVASHALGFAEALELMRERTLSVARVPRDEEGVMLALACSSDRAEALLRGLPGSAAIAADNAPTSCIVSVDAGTAAPLIARCLERAIECRRLDVSDAYHSELIRPAQAAYGQALKRCTFRVPDRELVSSVTGGVVQPEAISTLLLEQLVTRVRFRQATEELYARGCRLFLECGPRRALATFAEDTLAGRPHSVEATLHPRVGELRQVARAVAWAWVHQAGSLDYV